MFLTFVLALTTNLAAATIPEKAVDLVKAEKAILLDVREADEVQAGMVKGARHFATSKVGTPEWEKFVGTLQKDKEIFTYCARGGRADKVAATLRERGFKASGAGGFAEWIAAGAVTNK
jgi:rhodanese-related sulfurtransferase